MFTVLALPGEPGKWLRVFAGAGPSLLDHSREALAATWNVQPDRRYDLVIATISGPPATQTWSHVGRAIAAASQLVTEKGSIAICCDLSPASSGNSLIADRERDKAQAGPRDRGAPSGISEREAAGFSSIANGMSIDSLIKRMRKEWTADALPVLQVSRALQKTQIYLLSRLSPGWVEDLGLAPVVDTEEIQRLIRRHHSPIVLENAHLTRVTAPL